MSQRSVKLKKEKSVKVDVPATPKEAEFEKRRALRAMAKELKHLQDDLSEHETELAKAKQFNMNIGIGFYTEEIKGLEDEIDDKKFEIDEVKKS
jgi:cob(I)alamin adenosyltransferase